MLLMKLKIVNKRMKLEVRKVITRNKVLKRDIRIMMKLWEILKTLNPQYLMVRLKLEKGGSLDLKNAKIL